MRICIIGGDGFVGSVLKNRLRASNIECLVADIEPRSSDSVYVNVEDPTTLTCVEGCDTVIHLAAEHRDNVTPVSRYMDVNVIGAENLCNAARSAGVKQIVFTSSVAVYGFAPYGTSETGELNPFNEYGRTKLLAEEVFRRWRDEDPAHRSLVIVRPTVIFGEGNRGNVYNLINQIASKRFAMIGSGQNVKSMAYVQNVAAFLEFTTNFGPGFHLYNYVDGPDISVNELVSIVRFKLFRKSGVGVRVPVSLGLLVGALFDGLSALTGRTYPISKIRVKKFTADSKFSSDARRSGFQAPYTIKEAFIKTIEHDF